MNRTSMLLALVAVAVASIGLAACQTPVPTEVPEPTAMVEPTEMMPPTEMPTEAPMMADMLTTLQEDGRFTTLLGLVGTAGITDTLTGPGPITLLAPTDDAFAALPMGTIDDMTPEQVKDLLMAHILGQKLTTQDVADAMDMTMEGTSLMTGTVYEITSDGSTVTIDGKAKVIDPDIETSNGVIQVIDTVLLPSPM
jgi:uncharacterized surface protein with fasciclin (FAS1) repeats